MLQPRFAMGMAMTMLSFAMLGRFAGIEVRQLKPSDLDPVKVCVAAEDRVQRTWERTVKYYENLRVVFEIQTQLKEWTEDQAAPTTLQIRRAIRNEMSPMPKLSAIAGRAERRWMKRASAPRTEPFIARNMYQ